MDRDQIICPCLDITAGQIIDAYEEGAKTVEAIKDVTGVGRINTESINKKRISRKRFFFNADGGTRTHTSIRTTDFESVSSASSDTSADSIVRPKIYYHFFISMSMIFIKLYLNNNLCEE